MPRFIAKRGIRLYIGHLRGPVTLKPIAERFSSGAVTTFLYDLGLSVLSAE